MNFTISIGQMVVAALVSVITSGVIGALISRYFDRAKTNIVVSAISFSGRTVKLSDEAVEASQKASWGENLSKFSGYDALVSHEQEISILIENLESAAGLVSTWIQENPIEAGRETLPLNELKRVPYFLDASIGQTIIGSLRRRELPPLPRNSKDLAGFEKKLEMQEREDAYVLYLGSFGSRFPYLVEEFTENEVQTMKLLALSFSVGHLENIRSVLQFVASDFTKDLNLLHTLRRLLSEEIVAQSRPRFEIVLVNRGKLASVISSHCVIELSIGAVRERVVGQMVMEGKKSSTNSRSFANFLSELNDGGQNKPRGQRFYVEPFLSGESSSSFSVVPGGGSITLEFESITPIGEMKKIENDMFEKFSSGYVDAKVICFDDSEKPIYSATTKFGKGLSLLKEKALLEDGS